MEDEIMSEENREWTGEERLIRMLRTGLERHPLQLNDAFAADAELIDLPGSMNLACTVDTLREEIEIGIIEDPALIGWTSVAISLSDLAAVGADPLGLLLAWTIPPTSSAEFLAEISRGAMSAARFHKSYLLGGDYGPGSPLQITATALGTVPKKSTLQRIGMAPGHSLYLTGLVGLGNALGFAKLQKLPESTTMERSYRPVARFDCTTLLREFASCCIDTSDGVFASLDILARLNNCGVEFTDRPSLYAEPVQALALRSGLPLWLFAAAEHGEFELLFSVAPAREREFLEQCSRQHLACYRIGTAVREKEFRMTSSGTTVEIDIRKVRRLAESLMEDPLNYIASLIEYSQRLGIKKDTLS